MFSFLAGNPRNLLALLGNYWADRLPDEEIFLIGAEILDAFESFKAQAIDERGFLKAAPYLHISEVQPHPLPHVELNAWQCAGPFIRNDIDLAIALWLDDDPVLEEVVERHGSGQVFSIIGLSSIDSAHRESIVRLNYLLVELLIIDGALVHDALSTRAQTLLVNLASAREKSLKKRMQRGRDTRNALRRLARDYLLANPAMPQRKLITRLHETYAGHSEKTIARLIAGVRREVHETIESRPPTHTDLYATDHKRNLE